MTSDGNSRTPERGGVPSLHKFVGAGESEKTPDPKAAETEVPGPVPAVVSGAVEDDVAEEFVFESAVSPVESYRRMFGIAIDDGIDEDADADEEDALVLGPELQVVPMDSRADDGPSTDQRDDGPEGNRTAVAVEATEVAARKTALRAAAKVAEEVAERVAAELAENAATKAAQKATAAAARKAAAEVAAEAAVETSRKIAADDDRSSPRASDMIFDIAGLFGGRSAATVKAAKKAAEEATERVAAEAAEKAAEEAVEKAAEEAVETAAAKAPK